MELQENLVVADRFRLVRMIGRGGMGSVWQAVHIALDQPCAVKFIEGQLGNVADAHARFEREAKAAAALRSPHVVQILDHGVWAERPYIAMELLEGEDLGKTIARGNGKLPVRQLLEVVEQVCRALTRAHAAGFVHRDLKPDNIFLVNDDDRLLVKILDFGVAKQTSQSIDGSNTKTGAMLGTPYYMSPEQAQGIKSVDARSDLWSLAVIVFQCLTGRLPFESEALGDLLVKIIVQPVPVPSQYGLVPPGFDAWWMKASDRNPDGRFPTAKDFSASLALALGAGVPATPARPPQTATLLVGVSGPGRTMATPAPNYTPQPIYPPQGYGSGAPIGHYPPQPQHGTSQMSGSQPVSAFSTSGNLPPKKSLPTALIVVIGIAAVAVSLTVGFFALGPHEPPHPIDAPSAVLATTAPSSTGSATATPSSLLPPPTEPKPAADEAAAIAAVAAKKAEPSKPGDHHLPPPATVTVTTATSAAKPASSAPAKGWNAGF